MYQLCLKLARMSSTLFGALIHPFPSFHRLTVEEICDEMKIKNTLQMPKCYHLKFSDVEILAAGRQKAIMLEYTIAIAGQVQYVDQTSKYA